MDPRYRVAGVPSVAIALCCIVLGACSSDPTGDERDADVADVADASGDLAEADTAVDEDAEVDTVVEDVVEDTVPDVSADADEDVVPDVSPDAGPDTADAPDVGADVETDTTDVDPDVTDVGSDTPDTTDAGSDTPDVGPDTPDVGPDTPDVGPDTPDVGPDAPDAADVGPDTPTDPFEACRDVIVEAPHWPDHLAAVGIDGRIELGQTHVVLPDETRYAPRSSAQRATLLLFTPVFPIASETAAWVRAERDGEQIGVISLAPPEQLPPALEQGLTDVPLAPYAEDAWSVMVPWSWMTEGTTFQIGFEIGGVLNTYEHQLDDLAPPHVFTVTRIKAVLFGEPDFDTSTTSAERVTIDFFAASPFAAMRWVDSSPWHVDEIVVRTADGPALVGSEAERLDVTTDSDHWHFIKNQMALRLSMANVGRGLVSTTDGGGDSSPYSFGTSVTMGWFRNPDGFYIDLDDAPYAAGWTGWTAMWADECGNGFIHEVGHSYTQRHFTEGTAASWGIADQYPLDGTNVEGHPWGFDTVRGLFRTWYRVDRDGPVLDGGELVGKRDPMNGGEPANAITCFPQYTAYHAQYAQDWAAGAPTIGAYDGAPGIFRWDDGSRTWSREAPPETYAEPVAVDFPVVTLIGTLGEPEGVSQTYPGVWLPSGNVFELPDPFTADAGPEFDGARYFLAIEYADGSVDHALIARAQVTGTEFGVYSVNVDARRDPQQVRLYLADDAWPGIRAEAAALLHTRVLELPDAEPAPVLLAGFGSPIVGTVHVNDVCDPARDCDDREQVVSWPASPDPITFSVDGASPPAPVTCSAPGDASRIAVSVVDEGGATDTAWLTMWREVRTGTSYIRVPLDDETPWHAAPDTRQSLVVRALAEDNAHLAEGTWTLAEPLVVSAWQGDAWRDDVRIEVSLDVLSRTPVDLAAEYTTTPVTTAGSSTYFVVRDASMGPTDRVWWDDGVPGPTVLSLPVTDGVSFDTLYVNAQRQQCGSERSDLNAGRGAVDCEHVAVLSVDPAANAHLGPGTWRSAVTAPLVLEARRWHAPNARELLGVFALDVSWTR